MTPIPHTALLFPGQGSQVAEMESTVRTHRPDLLQLAIASVGADPFVRVGEGTRFDQPAIFCASLAGFARLGRPVAAFHAGHSLGEVAALVAAGSLTEEDGVRVVAERGRLMDEAARAMSGGMLAVRASRDEVASLAESTGLSVANHNGPRQIVLSGADESVADAERAARELGLRAKRLPVAGAFHSPLMEPVVEPFRRVLATVEVRSPRVPVFSCVTAAPFDDVRARLTQALTSPVRWVEVMRALYESGAGRFVETGPGTVLTGLVRRSLEGVEALSADQAEPAHA